MLLLAIAALACSFFFWPEVSVVFLVLMLPCAFYHVFNSTGDNGGSFEGAIGFMWKMVLWIILVYAFLYYRSGLIFAGELVRPSFRDSLYFSVTTWTTLGYGDFTPTPRMRLITSSQALMGHVSMGVWIALLGLWIVQRAERRKAIHDHNRALISSLATADSQTKEEGEQASSSNGG